MMKTWCFFILLVMATGHAAVAQQATASPAEKAKAVVVKMTEICKLKPEQAPKVETAYLEYYTHHDALKKQKDILNKDVYDDRSSVLKKKRNTVLKSVLTAGQYKEWSVYKDKEKQKKKQEE